MTVTNKRYHPKDSNKLIGYSTSTHIASLGIVNGREEWCQVNKSTGEVERLEVDPATGEKKWVKSDVGMIMESGAEEEIKIDVDLTVEKSVPKEDPLKMIQKAKRLVT